MAVKKISVEEFLERATHAKIFDVRSPGEFAHASIPGAVSLPLFSDAERKSVGTLYKQEGRERAIREGLDFFGPKMRMMVEDVQKETGTLNENASATTVLVHCWRGGMRSSAVAWLLDLYGFNVFTLSGGYKAFRNYVLQAFAKEQALTLLGGYTGSGKTGVLHEMQRRGEAVIDLEGLASHKGSAFGGIGMPAQPSQEMFENKLAVALVALKGRPYFMEDESQRIGVLQIPHVLWKTMRTKNVFFLDIPFEERLKHILSDYGTCHKERLQVSIERIQKRLGPLDSKVAIQHLLEGNLEACFTILLKYYDKLYNKALQNRENPALLLNKIPCSTVDSVLNTEKLLLCHSATR